MKYLALAVVLAVFSINGAWATGPLEKPFSQTMVKCCIKDPALKVPPNCIQTTSHDCFERGGTEVKDCSQCK
jgi:hypothetical protein